MQLWQNDTVIKNENITPVTEDLTQIHRSVIDACKKGDTIAQYTLYNQYSKAMYNLAYRMMNNREDAEDILQESFADAFRKLASFRFESSFGAWLKTIIINRSINKLKKKKTELFTNYLPDKEAYDQADTDDSFKGDAKKVFKAIEKLPNGYRIVFTLYLLEGYDHSEIAQILRISESTSKTQYLRAKMKLKQLLAEEDLSWTN